MLLAETNDNELDVDEPETDAIEEVGDQYESTGGGQSAVPLAVMGVPMSQRPSLGNSNKTNQSNKRGPVPPQSA